MHKILAALSVLLVLAVLIIACEGQPPSSSEPAEQNTVGSLAKEGFDQFGYNYQARIFVGDADGVDRALDGAVWGYPEYANDHLVMKWNAEWDRGNAEHWANPPYEAWENNEWNGQVPNGSGEVWHYKIKWVGPCGCPNGTPTPNGGYYIWGQFEVLMSQGTTPNGHFWEAHGHSIPTGYGGN